MSEAKPIRFGYAQINTDEFAILSEVSGPVEGATVNVNMAFGFNKTDQVLAIQVKCVFLQQSKTLAVVAVSCLFRIFPEDWAALYEEATNKLTIPQITALHFASLTVSTARGVFHAKTEKHPINALILPPININDFIKGDLVLSGAEMTPAK